MASADILLRREGVVGHATLNRPAALNALTHEMALALETALESWRDDDEVRLVLVDAAGDRAFCAGGDIVALYTAGRAGDFASGQRFWRDEYRLNAAIARYPKPYVAIMDGIVMGGGVGISAHGSLRVVTERTMLAMPECALGLITDVGGTHLLARAPGHIGEYIGLTGARLGAADCLLAGFADAHVPSTSLPELAARLLATGDPDAVRDFARPPPDGTLPPMRGAVDATFRHDSVTAIMAALEAGTDEWHTGTLAMLGRAAPLSLASTLRAIRAARADPGLERALVREYRFVSRCMEHGEFLEGIRAAVIDKDRKPAWRWPDPDGLPVAVVDLFASAAEDGDIRPGESDRGTA